VVRPERSRGRRTNRHRRIPADDHKATLNFQFSISVLAGIVACQATLQIILYFIAVSRLRRGSNARSGYASAVRCYSAVVIFYVPAAFTCLYIGTTGAANLRSSQTTIVAVSAALVAAVLLPFLWSVGALLLNSAAQKTRADPLRAAQTAGVSTLMSVGFMCLFALASIGALRIANVLHLGVQLQVGVLLIASSLTFVALFSLSPIILAATKNKIPASGRILHAIARVQNTAGLTVDRVIVVDGQDEPNAYVAGLVPGLRYMFVTRSLVEQMPTPLFESVVAHELAHVSLRHLPKTVGLNIVVMLTSFTVLYGAKHFGLPSETPMYSTTLIVLLFLAARYGVVLPFNRRFEVSADRLAATWRPTGDLGRALDQMHSGSVTMGHQIFGKLMSTHPSLAERLRALKEETSSLGDAQIR
jgi:STE24 endopeptidase